ncbi:MAG: NusG domain II-containing protein [Clostridiales bacterium]|nr:MAG: NusG domain II-containing protein [Clostridiales bacterium]
MDFCRLCRFFAYGRTANLKAVIYLDGEKNMPNTRLQNMKKPISVTVDGTGRNIVEISKNGVRVAESDCTDKL